MNSCQVNTRGNNYYERSELLIYNDEEKSTQKIVRRRRPRRNYWSIISVKTTSKTSELAADRARDRARADAQRQGEQNRVHERLRSASRRQSAGGVGRKRERDSRARRRQSAGDAGSEQQAAAADALHQQVDEYLASFGPDKPLYQDGWAMGRCRTTSTRSYGRCGTSVVSCARSGGTRIRSAQIPLSTCEFCDARGTHVQV